MNIQAINDFVYLGQVYPTPYFEVTYSPFVDLICTPVNCYMYTSKDAFLTGNSYQQSYAHEVSNEIIFNDADVTQDTIEFLTSISPTTLFVVE